MLKGPLLFLSPYAALSIFGIGIFVRQDRLQGGDIREKWAETQATSGQFWMSLVSEDGLGEFPSLVFDWPKGFGGKCLGPLD